MKEHINYISILSVWYSFYWEESFKGYLDKHVLLAPMNVTSNAAMAKHSEFIHGMDNEPNSKSPPSVSVFIVERPII